MDGENQEAFYCEDDGEYRIYCSVLEFCIKRYFKNHLKSQTHINNIHKRQIISNNSI